MRGTLTAFAAFFMTRPVQCFFRFAVCAVKMSVPCGGKGQAGGWQRAAGPPLSCFRRYEHRYVYVSKRFTADSCSSYCLQGSPRNTSRIEPGRNLSPRETGNVVQERYLSHYVRRSGDHSGYRDQWKDNNCRNAGARDGRSRKISPL